MDAGKRIAGLLRDSSPAVRVQVINNIVERIPLATDSVTIRTDTSHLLTTLDVVNDSQVEAEPIELTCAATRVWHGRQLRLIIPGPIDESGFRHRDPELARLMREVYQARELVLLHSDKTGLCHCSAGRAVPCPSRPLAKPCMPGPRHRFGNPRRAAPNRCFEYEPAEHMVATRLG